MRTPQESVVSALESGNFGDDEILLAGLLLERSQGCETGFSDVDVVTVTPKQAERIQQALLFALKCHPDINRRGSIINCLRKLRDPLLARTFERELLVAWHATAHAAGVAYAALSALDSISELHSPEGERHLTSNPTDIAGIWREVDRYVRQMKKWPQP